MGRALDDLIDILELEQLEVNLFRGVSPQEDRQRVFGGQVAGQALVAAGRTVDADRPVHSLHAYFLRPGDPTVPILYEVDRIRDGRSFTTRRVIAIQHGQAIFNLSASFHVHEEGPAHQSPMSDAPDPDTITPELDLIRERAAAIPEPLRSVLTQDRPIDVRPIEPRGDEMRLPLRRAWFRAVGPLPHDLTIHQAILAYASDYGLLVTALQPHGIKYRAPGLQLASLDHSLWMHRPF